MKTLEIDRLTATRQGGIAQLSAVVRLGAYKREIFFRTAHAPIASCGDPFVPAVLLPAMQRKADLDIRPPVSEQVLLAAERIQAVESAWHPNWRSAKLDAAAIQSEVRRSSAAGAVGVFFSGGVDSFYTLQKHRKEITHLIFVSGFDLPLRRAAFRELVTRELRRTADEIALPLVEVETNLREFSNGLSFSWEEQHGAALAAVAHFLAPGFERIYIPSTYALPFLDPWGSHPGLDPLWASKSLELIHDGIEATRFDKVEALCSWDVALRNLRVCYRLIEGKYNCCDCKKCLWTMAILRAHGALERARSFSLPLDLQKLSVAAADKTEQRFRFIQAIAKVGQRGDDPELADALRKVLSHKDSFRHSFRRSVRQTRLSAYRWLRRTVRR
jgi:hypothetical protein